MCAIPSMVVPVRESFNRDSLDPHWGRIAIGRARAELSGHLRLVVNEAWEGQLALAQLDDYVSRPRPGYLWLAPLIMETRARFSHPGGEFRGTAGFGFWNNPAPLWGAGLEVRPNWVWFYYASPESTLALMPGPPSGFKAAVVCGARGGGLTVSLYQALVKAPVVGRRLAAARLPAVEMALDKELMAGWHTYRIAWLPEQISLQVDGSPVLETRHVPAVPLAFVAWVDNNYAALTPGGDVQLGHLRVEQPQWLEMEYLSIVRP